MLTVCFARFVFIAGRNASGQPTFPVIPDMIGYRTFDYRFQGVAKYNPHHEETNLDNGK